MKLVQTVIMVMNFGTNVSLVLQHARNVSEDLLLNVQNVLEEIICNWELQVVSRIVLLEHMKLVLQTNVNHVMLVV